MQNEFDKSVDEAGPSCPIRISGEKFVISRVRYILLSINRWKILHMMVKTQY